MKVLLSIDAKTTAQGIVLCLALLLSPSLGQSQERAVNKEQPPGQQERPAATLYPPLRVQMIEDRAEAETRQKREAEAEDREKANLLVQQELNAATQAINSATQDMRNFALFSTILTAIGSLLVSGTILLMIQANRAALRAAGAAVETVKITREIGVAQTRAHLFLELTNTLIISKSQGPVDVIVLRGKLKNAGVSPASEILVEGASRCSVPSSTLFDEADFTQFPIDSSSGPSSEIDVLLPCELPRGSLDRVAAGQAVFEAMIRFHYSDVFGGRHSENVRFMADQLTIGSGMIPTT